MQKSISQIYLSYTKTVENTTILWKFNIACNSSAFGFLL